ncbi:MAG: thioredoxin-disulfide reductase [Lachnospiraceae bacterium]|nr:thioredoxin-disulfide reductase [Lachnospiraceae bacterium]
MTQVYDMIVIGSGPAGLAAGIYAKRAELSLLVFEKEPMSGGQIVNTYEVDNYPGLPGMNGFELGMKLREHCEKLSVEFVNAVVKEFAVTDQMDGKIALKKVVTEDGTEYLARTVVAASGAKNRLLGVPGEKEFTGKGVSYCATCDGAFFRKKTVAVVGGGDVAVEDAIFLARLCGKVFVIHRRDEFRAAKVLSSTLLALENVEVLWDSVVDEVVGDEQVKALKISNKKTGESKEIAVDGVFIAVGTMPVSELFRGKVDMDEGGYLIADESGKTSVPGVYAAGDLRTKQLRQVVTAAADGANAVFSAEKYLALN